MVIVEIKISLASIMTWEVAFELPVAPAVIRNVIEKIDELKHSYVNQASGVEPTFQLAEIANENASKFVWKADKIVEYCSDEKK